MLDDEETLNANWSEIEEEWNRDVEKYIASNSSAKVPIEPECEVFPLIISGSNLFYPIAAQKTRHSGLPAVLPGD